MPVPIGKAIAEFTDRGSMAGWQHAPGKGGGSMAGWQHAPGKGGGPKPAADEAKVPVAVPDDPVGLLVEHFGKYMVMDETYLMVTAAWAVASYLTHVWSRFPHLAIRSDDIRCGKTTLLELMQPVCLNGKMGINFTPATLYRGLRTKTLTLLIDEANLVAGVGADEDNTAAIRSILNAGISRKAEVPRCVPPDHKLKWFPAYCPKVLALVGDLDRTLADRCLVLTLCRKQPDDQVELYREHTAEKAEEDLRTGLGAWAEAKVEEATTLYAGMAQAGDGLKTFAMGNDRTAQMLEPLQVVLHLSGRTADLAALELYGKELEARGEEAERAAQGRDKGRRPPVREPDCRVLLKLLRDHFRDSGVEFLSTTDLLELLHAQLRWARHGKDLKPITSKGVSVLLGRYNIQPQRNRKLDKDTNGYFAEALAPVFVRLAAIEEFASMEAGKAAGPKGAAGPGPA